MSDRDDSFLKDIFSTFPFFLSVLLFFPQNLLRRQNRKTKAQNRRAPSGLLREYFCYQATLPLDQILPLGKIVSGSHLVPKIFECIDLPFALSQPPSLGAHLSAFIISN